MVIESNIYVISKETKINDTTQVQYHGKHSSSTNENLHIKKNYNIQNLKLKPVEIDNNKDTSINSDYNRFDNIIPCSSNDFKIPLTNKINSNKKDNKNKTKMHSQSNTNLSERTLNINREGNGIYKEQRLAQIKSTNVLNNKNNEGIIDYLFYYNIRLNYIISIANIYYDYISEYTPLTNNNAISSSQARISLQTKQDTTKIYSQDNLTPSIYDKFVISSNSTPLSFSQNKIMYKQNVHRSNNTNASIENGSQVKNTMVNGQDNHQHSTNTC